MMKIRSANFTLYPGNGDLERTSRRRPRKVRSHRHLLRTEGIANALAALFRRAADRFDGGRP